MGPRTNDIKHIFQSRLINPIIFALFQGHSFSQLACQKVQVHEILIINYCEKGNDYREN